MREIQVVSQRSGGLIVKGLVGGENVIYHGSTQFEGRRQNQDQGTIMSTATLSNTATQTKVVQVRNVSKVFKREMPSRLKALDDVSIEIAAGEFMALMGPSGSGKTTLLNMIAAIDKPTSGELLVLGENVFRFSDLNPRTGGTCTSDMCFRLSTYFRANRLQNVELPLLLTKLTARSSGAIMC